MNRIIPFFVFVLFAFGMNAQTLEITPNSPVDASFDGLDLTDNYLEPIAHFAVQNVSSEEVSLRWVRNISSDCNAAWEFPVCDNNQCYAAAVSSNINSSFEIPAVLAAGESSDLFALHIRPKGQAGCCTVSLDFYLTSDPDVIIETVEFDVRINDPDCQITSTSEAVISALRVFPNPMTDYFQLEGNEDNDVKQLAVYNVIGRQVRSFDATAANRFDMTGLPGGIYLVGMIGEDGEILKTVRMSRQILRP